MWNLHDRAEEHITEASCRQEIASFERYGQLVPVLGRALEQDPAHDIELIFGARRLFVARHLNVPLRVELRKLSDREAIISMDIENRQRQDLSSYERGLAYTRWLRDGYFSSQDDIANSLGISAAQVSKLLKIARLPAVILNAFGSVADIREGWGLELAAALEDPQRRDRTIRKARAIAREPARPSASEVCRQLLAASCAGRKPAAEPRDEVILSDKGTPLFRVRHTRKSVMLLLPVERVSVPRLREIVRVVSCAFQHENAAGSTFTKINSAEKRQANRPDPGDGSPGDRMNGTGHAAALRS
jgi:ParB family chromosome partitioning protein